MTKTLKLLIFIATFLLPWLVIKADNGSGQALIGRILIAVENKGQAWYVNPKDAKRYYLGRPADAFNIMKISGIGIKNADLEKIKIGILKYNDGDEDGDGLTNRFESALGTQPNKADTDGDGYNDKLEIENNYSPLGIEKILVQDDFAASKAGRIFIQVEKKGEAWYIDLTDNKRYFLGSPDDAFTVMRSLGLGITNINLDKINIGSYEDEQTPPIETPSPEPIENNSYESVYESAITAIRAGDKSMLSGLFIPGMKTFAEHTIDILDQNGRNILAEIMASATVSESSDSEIIYTSQVYFSGDIIDVKFKMIKENDTWWLTNL